MHKQYILFMHQYITIYIEAWIIHSAKAVFNQWGISSAIATFSLHGLLLRYYSFQIADFAVKTNQTINMGLYENNISFDYIYQNDIKY